MLLSHYRHTKTYTVKDTITNLYLMLYRFIYFIPLAAMGFKPVDIICIFAACQIWGILVHTEHVNKLGWLEYFLVTPSHHRVHHASNALRQKERREKVS